MYTDEEGTSFKYYFSFFIIFAGFPPTTTLLGTSFVTTAPDAITALSPIVTPGLIIALPPIHTLSPIVTGFPYSDPLIRSIDRVGALLYKCEHLELTYSSLRLLLGIRLKSYSQSSRKNFRRYECYSRNHI